MKKLLSFLLIIPLLLLCACKSKDGAAGYPLTVNGAPLDSEVYSYFLSEAAGELPGGSKNDIVNLATQRAIRYVAVNSAFTVMGLSLTPAEKAGISNDTNALWNVFGEYYTEIGVSKETFFKIKTGEAYLEPLRTAFFGEGGQYEIPEDTLKEVFDTRFVGYKYVSRPLWDYDVYGSQRELTPEEKQHYVSEYSAAADKINSGSNADTVILALTPSDYFAEKSQEITVLCAEDNAADRNFFNAVSALGKGQCAVFEYDGHIRLICRADLLSGDSLFKEYSQRCLEIASELPLDAKINEMCASYASVRDTKVSDACYDKVMKIREKY